MSARASAASAGQGVNDNVWAADCETDPFDGKTIPEPFVWGAYNIADGTYFEFWTTGEFLAWARKGKKTVYAHNGGKFDWHYVLPEIPLYSRVKVINGRLAKFKIGDCEFRDSWNILPLPLSQYKKDDIDYAKFTRDMRSQHMDEIRRYLKNDCVYLAELVDTFRKEHGNALTLAGAAMKFWEKQTGEKADRTDALFYDTFSPWYAGGRVQCFEYGEVQGPIHDVDINSAYPRAMMEEHAYGSTFAELDELPSERDEVSRCFIELEAESTGAFFFRSATGRLGFPSDGKLRTFHVTGWEYNSAVDTGTLRNARIVRVVRFARTVNFRVYVNHWYGLKSSLKKGTAHYIISKFFLNSLYGKFGANPAKYRDYEIIELADIYAAMNDNPELSLENIEGDLALVSIPTPEAQQRYFNVATAASITGYVRAVLWRAICGAKGVVYCDTDNIKARDVGDLHIDPIALGGWSPDATYTHGYVAGKKLYTFTDGKKWTTASKGVKLSADEVRQVALGEDVTWASEAPTFRINGNTVYEGENIGHVKRDGVEQMFTRRTVRMVRTDDRELDICPTPKTQKARKSANALLQQRQELRSLFRP